MSNHDLLLEMREANASRWLRRARTGRDTIAVVGTMFETVDQEDEYTAAIELVFELKMASLDRLLDELFGMESQFAPDDLAPPTDQRLLIAFMRNELRPHVMAETIDLIASFRSWSDALCRILRRGDHLDRPS